MNRRSQLLKITDHFFNPTILHKYMSNNCQNWVDYIRKIVQICTNVLPPQRGGAVPSPIGDGSKWQDRSPEGLDRKVAPIVLDCFFAGPPVDRSQLGGSSSSY